LGPSSIATRGLYAESVNPQWVRLLELLNMNVRYQRCQGVELFAEDGRRYLDFLSGYCVHNTGHNHPHIIEAGTGALGPSDAAESCSRAGG